MYYKNEKGFTFIEVLVSITILAMIITPLLSLFIQGFGNNRYAGLNSMAVGLAQSQMEELKAEGLKNIKENKLNSEVYYDSRESENGEVEVDGFTIYYELYLLEDTVLQSDGYGIGIELLQIEVYVLWEDKRPNEMVLKSYLTNR